MSRKRISRAHSDPPLCAEPHPDDGNPRLWTDLDTDDADRKPDRKTLQLCAQIERALHTAWPAALADLVLLSVEPAPDASRLELVIGVPQTCPASAATRSMQSALAALRAEASRAINRKKTPTFTFRLVPLKAAGEESHE